MQGDKKKTWRPHLTLSDGARKLVLATWTSEKDVPVSSLHPGSHRVTGEVDVRAVKSQSGSAWSISNAGMTSGLAALRKDRSVCERDRKKRENIVNNLSDQTHPYSSDYFSHF